MAGKCSSSQSVTVRRLTNGGDTECVSLCNHWLFAAQDRVPFAVVGSNTFIDVGGKKVRGRAYPWGVVEGT